MNDIAFSRLTTNFCGLRLDFPYVIYPLNKSVLKGYYTTKKT